MAKTGRQAATLLVLALTLTQVTGCTTQVWSSTSFTRNWGRGDGVSKPDDFPVLRASGYAVISRQPGPTYTDRGIQAMRVSKMEAYRELAEQLNGLYLKTATTVDNTRQRQDQVSLNVDGYVKGARVIRQYPVDDQYVTELELDTKVVYDLYDLRGAL